MIITKAFLDKYLACKNGLNWVTENNLIGLDHKKFIKYFHIATLFCLYINKMKFKKVKNKNFSYYFVRLAVFETASQDP